MSDDSGSDIEIAVPTPPAITTEPELKGPEKTKRERSERQRLHWQKVLELRRKSLEATRAAREKASKVQRVETARKRMLRWGERLRKDMETWSDTSGSSDDDDEQVPEIQDIGPAAITSEDLVKQIVNGLRNTHISQPQPPPPQQPLMQRNVTLSYV